MEFITTNPKGNRIVYVKPDENNLPQISCWYFVADNWDLLFGLLEADDIKIDTLDKYENRKYLILQRRDNQGSGAIAIKYTREGEEGDQDYIIHDIDFGEDFNVAADIIMKYYDA